MKKKIRKKVDDLGAASYVKLLGYNPVGKKGRSIFFDISEDEEDAFQALLIEYIGSICNSFDMCLLTLKKMPDYLPPEPE